MPWLLASPRHRHPWYWLYKIGIEWIMQGRILIILAISLFKSDRKRRYVCTLQNEIDTHKLNLFNNKQFIITIEIGRVHILPSCEMHYVHIFWKLTPFSNASNTTWSQNSFSRQSGTYIPPIVIAMAVDDLATQRIKSPIAMPLTQLNQNKPRLFGKVMHTYLSTQTTKMIFWIYSQMFILMSKDTVYRTDPKP